MEKKISDLPFAQRIHNGQQFEVNDNGTSRRVSIEQIRNVIINDIMLTKIEDLPAAVNPLDEHQFEVEENEVHKRLSFKKIREALKSSFKELVPVFSDLGKKIVNAANPSEARRIIGASDLKLGNSAETAKRGNWRPHIEHDTDGNLPWHRISGVPAGLDEGVVSDIRLGWAKEQEHWEDVGWVAVAVGGKHGKNTWYRAIQKRVNGQWITISVQ